MCIYLLMVKLGRSTEISGPVDSYPSFCVAQITVHKLHFLLWVMSIQYCFLKIPDTNSVEYKNPLFVTGHLTRNRPKVRQRVSGGENLLHDNLDNMSIDDKSKFLATLLILCYSFRKDHSLIRRKSAMNSE